MLNSCEGQPSVVYLLDKIEFTDQDYIWYLGLINDNKLLQHYLLIWVLAILKPADHLPMHNYEKYIANLKYFWCLFKFNFVPRSFQF